MATSQHRCVFVGNIPYDATEEQLIDICNEVGPVVSFRLVTDRDTGKPKGYGFCEYKDEETALSARRNLQGYEINGRQLRVDFAENDKASDKSREQGRGGPGLAPNADPSKQGGAPAILGDASQHQPVGLQIAISAAAAIAGALGGAQGQLALGNDPLTLHLAKMSRSQLNEVLYEMKIMATQNKELSRQLLLTRPQLSKALFQAQIMLGMVTPQVLQAVGSASQTPFQVSALPPLAQSSTQSALLPKVHESQVSTVPQNALIARSQVSAPQQFPLQPRVQLPPHANEHALQQASIRGNSLVSPFPPLQHHSSSSLSVRPQISVPITSYTQQTPSSSSGYNSQMVHSNATMQPSVLPRHSDARYQPGPSTSAGILQPTIRPAQIAGEGTQGNRNMTNSNYPTGLGDKKRPIPPADSIAHPSKMRKLGDRTLPGSSSDKYYANGSTQPQVYGVASSSTNPTPRSEPQHYETKMSQSELPSAFADPALLEQVLKLTPEQLSSLPPDQKQQVIQLQQMLRREQTQPS